MIVRKGDRQGPVQANHPVKDNDTKHWLVPDYDADTGEIIWYTAREGYFRDHSIGHLRALIYLANPV